MRGGAKKKMKTLQRWGIGLGLAAIIGGCTPKVEFVEQRETEESCSPTKKRYVVKIQQVERQYLAGLFPIPETSKILQTRIQEYDCALFRISHIGTEGHLLVKESLIAYNGKVTVVQDGMFKITDLTTGRQLKQGVEYKIEGHD